MSKNHRQFYHRAWSQMTPPLLPHPAVVRAVKELIEGLSGRMLLLGVTPQLASIAPNLIAIDRNLSMVQNIWPGNTASRRAVVGDWCNTNFASESFVACIGDGSLCGHLYPRGIEIIMRELYRVMMFGGRFVCRLYLSPDKSETIGEVKDAAMAGAIENFHTCKFRLAMALANNRTVPEIGVETIFKTFNTLFGDRDELVRVTGWSRAQIDTIDHYRDSNVIFCFPTRDQILSLTSMIFANPRLISVGGYPMADRCPLLVAEKT